MHEHGKQRALGHASSGPCLQQNLVCVAGRQGASSWRERCAVVGIGMTKLSKCRDDVSMAGLVPRGRDPRARRRRDDVERHRGGRDRHRARHLRGRDDARAVPRRRARRGGQADHARAHRGQRRRFDRGRRHAPRSSRGVHERVLTRRVREAVARATPTSRSRAAAAVASARAATSRRTSARTSSGRARPTTSARWSR